LFTSAGRQGYARVAGADGNDDGDGGGGVGGGGVTMSAVDFVDDDDAPASSSILPSASIRSPLIGGGGGGGAFAAPPPAPTRVVADAGAVEQLVAMGFDGDAAADALCVVNNSVEAAAAALIERSVV
jgi:hypothetical protein